MREGGDLDQQKIYFIVKLLRGGCQREASRWHVRS